MFSAVIDIHRNILSAQCYIKYQIKETSVNNMKIIGTDNALRISLNVDDDHQKEIKILMPKNFFIPTSILSGENSTCSIDVQSESFKILQKSNYFKYRKVMERNLEVQQSESPQTAKIFYKRFKTEHIDKNIDVDDVLNVLKYIDVDNVLNSLEYIDDDLNSLERKIDYSEHCISVEDVIESNFRVQITDSNIIPKSSSDFSSYCDSPLYEFLKSEIQVNVPYQVVCSKCEHTISASCITFQAVKKYCSNYSDLMESWFCHKRVIPRAEVSDKILYVGDAYIYLHTSISNSFLTYTQGHDLKCKNCQTLLTHGMVPINSYKQLQCFFADTIIFQKSETEFDGKKTSFNIVSMSLLSIIHQKTLPFSKLFLQTKVGSGEEKCLLLWIPTSEVAQFRLQAVTELLPPKVDLSLHPVYKVQYMVGSLARSPLIQGWSKEFGVDYYKVSLHFMDTLIDILRSSTECISNRKEQSTQDFESAYISLSLPFVPKV